MIGGEPAVKRERIGTEIIEDNKVVSLPFSSTDAISYINSSSVHIFTRHVSHTVYFWLR